MRTKLLSKAHVFAVAVLVFAVYITVNTPTLASESVVFSESTITGPNGEAILIPDNTRLDTTPVVLLDNVYVPEESPEGGHPKQWLENSPEYSDGWVLLVDDAASPITVQWHTPKGI